MGSVIYQPSLLPEQSCVRSGVEPVQNPPFAALALGSIAWQLNQYKPGDKFEGAQNWWAHFSNTEQYANYPPSIAGFFPPPPKPPQKQFWTGTTQPPPPGGPP